MSAAALLLSTPETQAAIALYGQALIENVPSEIIGNVQANAILAMQKDLYEFDNYRNKDKMCIRDSPESLPCLVLRHILHHIRAWNRYSYLHPLPSPSSGFTNTVFVLSPSSILIPGTGCTQSFPRIPSVPVPGSGGAPGTAGASFRTAPSRSF